MTSRAVMERVRFVHGQRLRAADLADAAGGELRRQELHVVAAHRTWGVARGLEVWGAKLGVRVSAGLAYDAYGRSIVVPRPTGALASPELLATADAVELVASWTECGAALRLVGSDEARPGIDVPLARFPVESGRLGQADLAVRRGTRSLAARRIGSGEETFDVRLTTSSTPFSAAIDTSAAGFTGAPSYVVTPQLQVSNRLRQMLAQGAVGPLVSVVEATATSLRLEVRVVGAAELAFGLVVAWLGVEPPPSCPPPISPFLTLNPTEVP